MRSQVMLFGAALAMGLSIAAQPVEAEPTKFTMTCTGDGSEKLKNEKFSCSIDVAHAKEAPNTEVPKSVTGVTFSFLEVTGEQHAGPICPTWVFKNGQWVRIC